MKMLRLFCLLAALVGGWSIIPTAQANCSTPDLPHTSYSSGVAVSDNLETGAVIPGSEHPVAIDINCYGEYDNAMVIACYTGGKTEVPGMPGVYQTNIPGVGLTLINKQGQRVTGTGSDCDSSGMPLATIKAVGNANIAQAIVTQALVKIAPTMGSGTLDNNSTRYSVLVKSAAEGTEPLGGQYLYYRGSFNSRSITCSLNTTTLTFNMGDISTSLFSGQYSTTPPQHQDFTLVCDDYAYVNVLVQGANGNLRNNAGVIRLLDEDGAALGVGVQMRINDNIAPTDDYTMMGSIAPGASDTFSVSVQYMQTEEIVVPGKANAAATISISYN
ncbi:fimbrial protein [Cronobacter dublinensis]|uniref:fimbrial protein n=1 Tax=Cronobacter dublinensis TaxID=413497 RepID=UPI000CFCC9FC|nr:fimbrial protein [Cronobacter dublinensis]